MHVPYIALSALHSFTNQRCIAVKLLDFLARLYWTNPEKQKSSICEFYRWNSCDSFQERTLRYAPISFENFAMNNALLRAIVPRPSPFDDVSHLITPSAATKSMKSAIAQIRMRMRERVIISNSCPKTLALLRSFAVQSFLDSARRKRLLQSLKQLPSRNLGTYRSLLSRACTARLNRARKSQRRSRRFVRASVLLGISRIAIVAFATPLIRGRLDLSS